MFDEPEILYGGGAHLDLSIPDLYVKCGPHQGGHAGSYMSQSRPYYSCCVGKYHNTKYHNTETKLNLGSQAKSVSSAKSIVLQLGKTIPGLGKNNDGWK